MSQLPGPGGGGIWLASIDLRMVPEPADEARGIGPLIRLYAGDGMLPHADEEALRTLELERTLLVEQRTHWQAEQAQASERERAEWAEAELAQLWALLEQQGEERP